MQQHGCPPSLWCASRKSTWLRKTKCSKSKPVRLLTGYWEFCCVLSNRDIFFFFLKNKFIYLFLAALGLCCCTRAFSRCGDWGLLFIAVHSLLIVVACLCCRERALGTRAAVVVAHGLSSCGSQAVECRLSSRGARA